MTTIGVAPDAPQRRTLSYRPTAQDRGFVAAARAAAVSTLVVMGLIGFFLLIGALPALRSQGFSFLTTSQWLPETGHFGIASLLWGTILVGLFALAVAVPVGFGAALFISEYAPRSLKKPLVTLVDLMAAVPSIVYAIWALFFLQAHLLTVAQWLSVHLGPVLPFLRVNTPDSQSSYTSSAFIAGIAVGVVVLPTVTSIMREVFAQAPIGEREGAIALGATRWGMIRAVVIPSGGRASSAASCSASAGPSARPSWSTRSSRRSSPTPPTRCRAAPTPSPPTSPSATPSPGVSPSPGSSAPG